MISADDLRPISIFSSLSEAQREHLASTAADIRLSVGEFVMREGDAPYFFVLLEGEVRVVKEIVGLQRDFHSFRAGEFFGEIPILLGTRALASARAQKDSRLARFERHQLQELVRDNAAFSAAILQTMNERLMTIQRLAHEVSTVRVFVTGASFSDGCRNLRAFLSANRIPYQWVDHDCQRSSIPVAIPDLLHEDPHACGVLVDCGEWMISPTVRHLADLIGLQTAPMRDCYDVVVAGAGPAAWQQAFMAHRKAYGFCSWSVLPPEDRPAPPHA